MEGSARQGEGGGKSRVVKIRRTGIFWTDFRAEGGKAPVKAGAIPDSVTDLRKGFLYTGSAILVPGGGIFTKCQNIFN